MIELLDSPYVVFSASLVALWFSAIVGDLYRKYVNLDNDERADIGDALAATFTLLGLIVGFSFSMAINRYDLRKNYEEAEANAIGTEYLRADLLPAEDAAGVRTLLARYLDQRILFYTTRSETRLAQIDADTAKLQTELWSAVQRAAMAQPTAVMAIAVAGMNDVLNSQGFSQAVWWNRIPIGAWALMAVIAICCNVLFGFHARLSSMIVFLISPLTMSVAFFLISDIDSPRGGVIRVLPQNLISLSRSMIAH
jgi:hypothetical protein